MVSLLPCSSHPQTIGNLSGKQKVGRSSVPSCYGATKSTGPRPGQTREVQAKQLQSLPRPLWSGCQRPTCLHGHNVLRKLGTLPRYSSKSCKFFFYLKSPNNSSTALRSISFTGIEFAIFSCSCVCRTRHSSPISAPHTAHTPHSVPSLFSSSVLGNLSVSSQFGSSRAPCSPATSCGTTRRGLPGTERPRNTFAHEQHHQPHCEALSGVSKVFLKTLHLIDSPRSTGNVNMKCSYRFKHRFSASIVRNYGCCNWGTDAQPPTTNQPHHEQHGQEEDRKPPWASAGTGTYVHCDLHVGALRSFPPGRLQEPAKQHSVFWHVEVEELGVPIPAVEGQLLCALREVFGDVQGV